MTRNSKPHDDKAKVTYQHVSADENGTLEVGNGKTSITSLSASQTVDIELLREAVENDWPTDRGWAWVILAAAWLNYFLIIGVYKTFGIMFIEVQQKYNSSSSMTSLIVSILNAFFSVFTFLVTTIGLSYFSTRQSVMFGAMLMTCTFIMSAFAPNIQVLIAVQGVGLGISQAFMLAPTTALIGQYFDKRRGLANCVAATGGSVGALFFSFALRACLDYYGLSGTYLIVAAINMHGVLAGAVMRPVSSYIRVKKVTKISEEQAITNLNDSSNVNTPTIPLKSIPPRLDVGANGLNYPLVDHKMSPMALRALIARNSRTRSYSERSKVSVVETVVSAIKSPGVGRYASTEFSFSSMLEINNISAIHSNAHSLNNAGAEEINSLSCFRKLTSAINCSIMRSPVFLFFLPFGWLLCTACSVIQTYLPPLAKDNGLSNQQGSFLITIIAAVDIGAMLFWGVVADKDLLKKHNIIALATISLGVGTCFISLYNSLETFVIFSVIYGLLGRIYYSLYPVVMVDFLGLENLRSVIGITILTQSSFICVMLPVIGLMRDHLGSYVPSYYLIAAFLLVGGCGVTFLPLVDKCARERKQKSRDEEIS